MSYSLLPYMVDLAELRRAVGSKDEALVAAIMQADPDVFVVEGDEELSLGGALRHLVMGEPLQTGSAHQYGYALKQLCAHLGTRLDADCWEAIRWDVIEASGVEEILVRTGPPVPLPPNSDFPRVGHLTAEEIAHQLARLGSGRLQTAAPSGRRPRRSFRSWLVGLVLSRIVRRSYPTEDDLQELLEEYEGWLRGAADRKQSIVFFYH